MFYALCSIPSGPGTNGPPSNVETKGDCMTSEAFFSQCGEFISHIIHSEGAAPMRKFTVQFLYTNGCASYNGQGWTYHLREE